MVRYGWRMDAMPQPVGDLLRDWRMRRHFSQLDLAADAGVSARHISFLETGRARPSREMLLRIAERLDVPLRERNRLLLAAGYAPVYQERMLDDPAMAAARAAVDLVLAGHEPFPALAIDARWTLIAANRAIAPLIEGAAPELLAPPVNVLRLTLHPAGLASRITNFAQLRAHLLERLERQAERTADPAVWELLDELRGYPAEGADRRERTAGLTVSDLVVPMRLQTAHGLLTFLSTTTVFGSPLEITLAELAIESFFPADDATRDILRQLAP